MFISVSKINSQIKVFVLFACLCFALIGTRKQQIWGHFFEPLFEPFLPSSLRFWVVFSAIMASCGYSQYVGGDCGANPERPESDQCVRIAECCKDIKGHLRTYGVSESALNSEARLLLARAGKPHTNYFCFCLVF